MEHGYKSIPIVAKAYNKSHKLICLRIVVDMVLVVNVVHRWHIQFIHYAGVPGLDQLLVLLVPHLVLFKLLFIGSGVLELDMWCFGAWVGAVLFKGWGWLDAEGLECLLVAGGTVEWHLGSLVFGLGNGPGLHFGWLYVLGFV